MGCYKLPAITAITPVMAAPITLCLSGVKRSWRQKKSVIVRQPCAGQRISSIVARPARRLPLLHADALFTLHVQSDTHSISEHKIQ